MNLNANIYFVCNIIDRSEIKFYNKIAIIISQFV